MSSQEAALKALVVEIKREHAAIVSPGKQSLQHGVHCGELLLQAQEQVPKGEWVVWMRANLDIHPTTAFKYVRLARHKEHVLAGEFSGIDPAIQHLAGKRDLSDDERAEAIRLHDHGKGMSLQAIADLFGVSRSTVHYWVNAKARDRTKRLQRRQRERATRLADREAQAREVKTAGGKIADAYALVRRAEQRVDQRLAEEVTWDERRWLNEALDNLAKAEDSLVAAIRNAPPTTTAAPARKRPSLF